MNQANQVVELTNHLWRGGTYAYWWSLSKDGKTKETHWFPVANRLWPSNEWEGRHIYLGVHPTTAMGTAHQRAKDDTVAAVNCLFGDFDAKDEVLPLEYTPHLPPGFDALKTANQRAAIKAAQEAALPLALHTYKERALTRVQQCPLAPTWLIDSGGGYQCYWLLADTVLIDESNREHVKSLQSAWVELIGADTGAKDLTRVLRMPGSLNVKPYFDEYPRVTVVERDPLRLYALANFERLTEVYDLWTAAVNAMPPQRHDASDSDIIKKYNASVRIGDLLTQHDYQLGGTHQDTARYSRPGKDKGQTSVMVWLDRNCSYHHSSSDSLYCDSGHARDAFDVFTMLEHGGDTKAAYIAAKKELGLWNEAPQRIDAQRESDGLPEIQVNNRQLRHILADALTALQRRNALVPTAPIIYTFGGVLGRFLPSSKTVQTISKDALSGIFAESADWVKIQAGDDGPKITNVNPPHDAVNAFSGWGDWPTLPKLNGLITGPTYTGNGNWVLTPGYDSTSGLYLVDEIKLGDTSPTRVEWAKYQLLTELLGDFPLVDNASRAHLLSLALLPFVRHIIDGPTPLHLTDAPTAGTGKGKGVNAACFPALGGDIPSMSPGRDDDESRKRLTALLKKGSSHINIDNLSEKLDSPSLATALTQMVWEDRELGASHILRLPINIVWVATGNNVQPSEEIARRCVWIRMDSNTERPQERTGFRHADLLGWARQHRADLVTACVVLVNNWIAKGQPRGKYVKGSFEEWAAVMGGILDAAGVSGFLANERDLFKTAVSDVQVWTEFVQGWANAYRELEVSTQKLFPIASHHDGTDDHGLLDALLTAPTEDRRKRQLGIKLGGMADRVIGGWKICKLGMFRGYQQWQLKKILEADPPTQNEVATSLVDEVDEVIKNLF